MLSIDIFQSCPDYGAQKASSLAGFILRQLEQWLKTAKQSNEIYEKLDRSMKVFSIFLFGLKNQWSRYDFVHVRYFFTLYGKKE